MSTPTGPADINPTYYPVNPDEVDVGTYTVPLTLNSDVA
jgi:hypothetical protein